MGHFGGFYVFTDSPCVLMTIDNIELNISSVKVDTGAASQQLTTAAEYQRKAEKRAAC